MTSLRARYRDACLTAFVQRDDARLRRRLANWFVVDEERYPPALRQHVTHAAP
jgi:hypothetical protein